MSVHQLQIKALDEWYDSRALQREFPTPEGKAETPSAATP
jgi:hypothetical protein